MEGLSDIFYNIIRITYRHINTCKTHLFETLKVEINTFVFECCVILAKNIINFSKIIQ